MEHATFEVIDDRDGQRVEPLARYDKDPHAWAMRQADLIRQRRFDELDIENLADEVEDVANREYDKLESDLAIVIQHLLKWDHQQNRRSRSWANSIREHRRRVARHLDRSKSLERRRAEALSEAFLRGRGDAVIETDLPDGTFPDVNPYSWDDLMGRPIRWPEP